MSKFLSFLHINRKLLFQFLSVFIAFFIMVAISSYFGTNIVYKSMDSYSEKVTSVSSEAISAYGEKVVSVSAEAINAYIKKFALLLESLSHSIERLHARNAGIPIIRQELEGWTKDILSNMDNINSSASFYGYFFDSVYIDGSGWVPPSDYDPKSRPWYSAAYVKNGVIGYSEPYYDADSGEYNISVSIVVLNENNQPFGVVATDIFISNIDEYVGNMHFFGNGYGLLLDTNLNFVIHPNKKYIGKYITDINNDVSDFSQMADLLLAGSDLSAVPFINYSGTDSVVFSEKLFNGWYLGIILPSEAYWEHGNILPNETYLDDVKKMRFIMSVAGIILALTMCIVLAYMHINVNRSMEASKSKSSFLANMSHEIRTPMSAIIGMTEFLQHERLSDRQMDFVNDINFSARSLLSIINDILDMSKVEAGKTNLVPVNFDFYSFIDNIKSMLMFMTDKNGLEFKYKSSGNIPKYLYCDDVRLRQILTNICANAVKYTKKGYISLNVIAMSDKLLFRIEDTGRGLKNDEMDKIFNAFEQVNSRENRNFIGTGLGLSISKSYVEMMNGKILVESEYGKGTVFTVEIPAIRGKADEVTAESDALNENIINAPTANILVVDDNEFNLKTVEALLGLFNIKVKTLRSGPEAIDIVIREYFDIIFMDHMMPDMDGIETVHEIRKMGDRFNNLVIIALTANAIYGAKEMFLSNGFNDFISKPVDMLDLKKILIQWLPKEKVSLITSQQEGEQPDSEQEFQKALYKMFIEDNQNRFEEILNAILRNDVKLAHRLVHSLKSNAGQIGKKELQTIAAGIEKQFKDGATSIPREDLNNLEKELKIVLNDIR